jgi:hypothetical protein
MENHRALQELLVGTTTRLHLIDRIKQPAHLHKTSG